jgi:hypothetical protein
LLAAVSYALVPNVVAAARLDLVALFDDNAAFGLADRGAVDVAQGVRLAVAHAGSEG